mmetsp:Transcript_2280/g.3659  ORF Transcript_2280/g.3659 Transcript_2280/m.3659 type:complete len:310 (-) Transcript_2280:29-958(-)
MDKLPGGYIIRDQISSESTYDLYAGESPDGRLICVKSTRLNIRQLKNGFTQEVFNLQKLTTIAKASNKASNIIKYITSFTDDLYGVLITEGYDYTLYNALENDILEEKKKMYYFLHICKAVEECSAGGVAHMDIHPKNIFIKNGRALLGNFNSSIRWNTVRSTSMKVCGTTEYRAPEITNPCGYSPYLVDLWSLGILLHYIITKKYPIVDVDKDSTDAITIDPEIPAPAEDLIRSLLEINPCMRLPVEEIVDHPIFEYYDVSDVQIRSDILERKKKKRTKRVASVNPTKTSNISSTIQQHLSARRDSVS